jgi:hypothetical protein
MHFYGCELLPILREVVRHLLSILSEVVEHPTCQATKFVVPSVVLFL